MIKSTPKNIIREIAPGVKMPLIGFGCYLIPENAAGKAAMENAIKLGYRHFDTAQFYENEKLVGETIGASGIPREEFFVTSKIWTSNAGYDKTKKSTEESLKKLNLGHIDLMLIHFPGNTTYDYSDERNKDIRKETWLALEEFVKAGKIKAIGVSNYLPKHMEEIKDYSKSKIACNQFELHPLYQEEETIKYCEANEIQIVAYCSLMRNKPTLMENKTVLEIAEQNKRTVGEVLLRWALAHNYAIIPKSMTPSRQELNLRVLDFDLSDEDVEKLDKLNCMEKFTWSPKGVA